MTELIIPDTIIIKIIDHIATILVFLICPATRYLVIIEVVAKPYPKLKQSSIDINIKNCDKAAIQEELKCIDAKIVSNLTHPCSKINITENSSSNF